MLFNRKNCIKFWDTRKLLYARFSDAKKCIGTYRQIGSVKLVRVKLARVVTDLW